jgi:hypothetical protein
MVMKVDLLPMPYRQARELLEYCVNRNIDMDQSMKVLEAFRTVGSSLPEEDWYLNVPDSHMTYFALKWS